MASRQAGWTTIMGAAALIWAVSHGAGMAAESAVAVAAPPASDAPVTTDSTAAQIADFLAEGADAPAAPAPRAIHGEIGGAVGTGGYHSAYGIVDIPVGANGDLGVAVDDTRFAQHRGRGGGDQRSLALSLRLDGSPAPKGATCMAHTGVALPSDALTAADCAKAAAQAPD